jgi:hypothetical protein
MFKSADRSKADALHDEMVRAAVARFLKNVSATAQGEIEKVVRSALASGKLKGHETFTTAVSLSSEKIGLNVTLYNTIEL